MTSQRTPESNMVSFSQCKMCFLSSESKRKIERKKSERERERRKGGEKEKRGWKERKKKNKHSSAIPIHAPTVNAHDSVCHRISDLDMTHFQEALVLQPAKQITSSYTRHTVMEQPALQHWTPLCSGQTVV